MAAKIRLGVIGLGNMGSAHLAYLKDMPEIELAGVCDIDEGKADSFAAQYGVPAYYSHADMYAKANLDAVIVAVPHYDHVPCAIDAFAKNIHVLGEKPITVHVNGANKMIAAYDEAKKKNPKLLFGLMFQERTRPNNLKLKELIVSGELGRLTRVTWTNTGWFRSQAYYNSGGWRATWAGEGGGILTNQCPHNLDTYNWLFGLPSVVHGFAHIGKYHDIEVEDEVTAYMEHENGMIGQFVASTGECPGMNRLEIVGENGTLVLQNGQITYFRNRQSMLEYSNTTPNIFGTVENWEIRIPVNERVANAHRVVTERFVRSIISGETNLIASAEEGVPPVMLANAIMLSSFEKRPIQLPMSGDAFEQKLNELIANSRFVKKVGSQAQVDFERSYTQ